MWENSPTQEKKWWIVQWFRSVAKTVGTISWLLIVLNIAFYALKQVTTTTKVTDGIWKILEDTGWDNEWTWWVVIKEIKKKKTNKPKPIKEQSDTTTTWSWLFDRFRWWKDDEKKDPLEKDTTNQNSEVRVITESYTNETLLHSKAEFWSFNARFRIDTTKPDLATEVQKMFTRVRMEGFSFEESQEYTENFIDRNVWNITLSLSVTQEKWNNVIRWFLLLPEWKISWWREVMDLWTQKLNFKLTESENEYTGALSEELSNEQAKRLLPIIYRIFLAHEWRE